MKKSKLAAARNYMVEYLENVCAHRYEKVSQAMQAVKEEEEDEVEKSLEETQEKDEVEIQIAEEEQASEQKDEQEMRFRAILEEFLA